MIIPSTAPLTTAQVLVIDDNEYVRDVLAMSFARKGLRVAPISSPAVLCPPDGQVPNDCADIRVVVTDLSFSVPLKQMLDWLRARMFAGVVVVYSASPELAALEPADEVIAVIPKPAPLTALTNLVLSHCT